MILEEFIVTLRSFSSDPLVAQLLAEVECWKKNNRTAENLKQTVERFLGNSWIQNEQVYQKIWNAWVAFEIQCIKGMGGMTMNERLYVFDLFGRFDQNTTEHEKEATLAKVLPNPSFQRTAFGGR